MKRSLVDQSYEKGEWKKQDRFSYYNNAKIPMVISLLRHCKKHTPLENTCCNKVNTMMQYHNTPSCNNIVDKCWDTQHPENFSGTSTTLVIATNSTYKYITHMEHYKKKQNSCPHRRICHIVSQVAKMRCFASCPRCTPCPRTSHNCKAKRVNS
jgi:hypothetical protein